MLCAGVWEGGDSVCTLYTHTLYQSIPLASTPSQPSHTRAQGAQITCLSCGAATPVQVVQDHAKEFLEKMNCKVLAPRLKALELIPEAVVCDILQSKSN